MLKIHMKTLDIPTLPDFRVLSSKVLMLQRIVRKQFCSPEKRTLGNQNLLNMIVANLLAWDTNINVFLLNFCLLLFIEN